MILEQYRKEILEEAARAAERGDQHGH
jgi:hypothetical protein